MGRLSCPEELFVESPVGERNLALFTTGKDQELKFRIASERIQILIPLSPDAQVGLKIEGLAQ
jgi:hypothetical protein